MAASTLYTGLIEEQTDDEAFIQVYWSRADHLGAAIEKMLCAARANGLTKPEPRQVDPYDIINLKGEVAPDPTAETFWATRRVFFDPEPVFLLPYGIIGSCIEGDHDVDEIAAGFTEHKDDKGMTTIAVNVTRTALPDLYSHLLNMQSSYRVFWYLLHEHWDNVDDQFLINESLDGPRAILAHLNDNKLDSLLNGYVTLTAYCEKGATNLNISDHKRVIIYTYSDEIAELYMTSLNEAGYPKMNELVSIDDRIHHWHYRHPESRDRNDLIRHLHSFGFKDWKPDN